MCAEWRACDVKDAAAHLEDDLEEQRFAFNYRVKMPPPLALCV